MKNLLIRFQLSVLPHQAKTKLSVELAKHFNGEIVSADSMQIYRGMQIATAKPTKEEMDGIPHHMMDFLPPDKTYSVASYVTDASKCIADIHSRGKLPFIVGGTGLYVDSLLNNVSFSDDKRDEDYCLELRKIAEEHGTDRLSLKCLQNSIRNRQTDFVKAEILKE